MMKKFLYLFRPPVALLMMLLFAAIIGATLFITGNYEREQTTSFMKSRMVASVQIRKERLAGHISQFRHDAQFLAQVPPVQGMVRAISEHGIDSQENTSLESWRVRLQTIFIAFLRANPDLTQVRFVGVANNGMELIRVERNVGSNVVSPGRLKAIGDRDYFHSARMLGSDQTFVSDINFAHEIRRPGESATQTIRAAAPVMGPDGKIFGFVILNHNVQPYLAELSGNSATFLQSYLTNSAGDYLLNPDARRVFGFEQGQQWRWQDDFKFVARDQGPALALESFVNVDGSTIHALRTRIELDENDSNRFLTLAIVLPDSVIQQAVSKAQLNALLIILVTTLLVAGATYYYRLQRERLDRKRSEMVAIVESSHDAIIGKTLDGVVTSWNSGAEEMFGYSSEQALHRRLVDLIVPIDRHGEESDILQKISGGTRITSFESVRHRKDGSLINVSVTVSPIRSSTGKVIGAAKTVRDISQKIADEVNVRELNRTLEIQVAERTTEIRRYSALQQAILNNAGYAIIAGDRQGLITMFNPAAEHMLGYTAEEMVGKQTPGILHDGLEVVERAKKFSADLGEHVEPGFNVFVIKALRGLPNEHEWTYVRKDGSRLPVLLSVTALRDDAHNVVGFLGIAVDLTERKILEQAVEAQNRFLDTLADNIPGLVAYWSNDLRCRFSNRSYYEWFGRTSEEMRGIHVRTLLGEDLYQKNEPYIQGAFAGQAQRFERTIPKPDGSVGYTWSHYIPDISDGKVRGMIVLVTDVTDLKLAQFELEVLNQHLEIRTKDLERTGQIAGVGAWSVDLLREKISWSKQTSLIHEVDDGYVPTMDEAIAFYTKEAQSVLKSVLETALATNQPWDVELPIVTAKGNHRWTRSVGQVELDERHQPIKLVGTFQDITERRLASEALTSTRDQLLMAAEVAKLGIWSWQLADDSLHWNDLMFELYDQPGSLKDAGLNYTHWHCRVHPDDLDAIVKQLSDAVAGNGSYDPVFRIVRSNGELRYLKAGAFVERDESGKAFRVTGINMDITEQLRLESNLRQAKESAEQANRAKSEFLANMSHEIRTPMNAILGMLQLLQQTGMDRRQIDYVSKTESAAKALLGILNDILDFSKVEAGKMVLDPHPFSIDKLLRDVAVILSANVGSKDLEVLFEVDPAVPTWIIGDALRLQQILINLAGNAIKFTEHGEVVLAVKLQSSSDAGLVINFSVRDTGIGIPPEHCDHIFEGFSQAEASTARRFGGTGLGLAISQRLVQMMGGTLAVTSTVDVGSTFHFTLHCKQSDQAEPRIKPRQAVDIHSLQCLVVEDNPTARQILAEMLRSFGWKTDTAESGQAAIDLVNQRKLNNPYDFIFVDWRMPDLDGWQTCERIRQILPESGATMILMVTAHSRELIAQHKAQMPAILDGFLIKPVTASMLYDAVADTRASHGQIVPADTYQADRPLRLAGLRILVVEDNVINQQIARELLSNDGATVVVKDGGQAGIDAIRAAEPQFDVVLMDVQMPDMDGYTATRIIRHELGETALPIIAITANAMMADRDAAIAAGMNDHVGKPFELSQLIAVILDHVGASSTAPSDRAASTGPASLEEFDADSALLRLGADSRIYLAALKGFVSEMNEAKTGYETMVRHQRYDDARRLFHTLRGLAATVGANKLAALAGTQENQLKDPSGANSPLQSLDAFWLSADQAIEWAQQQSRSIAQTEPVTVGHENISLLELRDRLAQLYVMLQSSDLGAEQKFEQLQSSCAVIFPVQCKEMWHYIEQLDFANAALICAHLLEALKELNA